MVLEWTIVNIITEIIVTIVTLVLGFSFLNRYRKTKKELMPYVALLGFLSAMFYLGPIASFISLLTTATNLDKNTVAFLSYSHMPALMVVAMYLGFSIFNPDQKKLGVFIFTCTAVPYWIALFGFPDVMIGEVPVASGELIDITIQSVVLAILAVYILSSLIILGGGFYALRKRLDGKDKRKATDLCLAFVIFAMAGILEATTPIFAFIARILMIISYIFMYRGFSAT